MAWPDGHGQTSASGATVLVCDDDPDLLDELRVVLSGAGYGVVPETSADAAIKRLDHLRPDIILSDIALPGMDGMTFLRRIRQSRPDLDDVPFIVLTGFTDKADVVAGKRAGADDYLVKPIDHELLLTTIDAQLRQVARIATAHSGVDPGGLGAGLAQAVDRLDFGFVLLDLHGRICFANRAAARLSTGHRPTSRHWLSHAFGEAEFLQAIAAAHDSLRKSRCYHSVALISQEFAQDNWRLIVLSDLGALPANPREPMMMGLILEAEDTRRLGLRLIADATGLTATECAVAELLARGRRLKDIADKLTISQTTVNFHLRNIFQKTATSRQADLMLLLRSVPLMECAHCAGRPADQGLSPRARD